MFDFRSSNFSFAFPVEKDFYHRAASSQTAVSSLDSIFYIRFFCKFVLSLGYMFSHDESFRFTGQMTLRILVMLSQPW